jgi:hypothetical protein
MPTQSHGGLPQPCRYCSIDMADLGDKVLDELLSYVTEENINGARIKPGKPPSQGLPPDAGKGIHEQKGGA